MAFLQSAPLIKMKLFPQEMREISLTIRREFSPRFVSSNALSRKGISFSAQELLTISQEIARDFAPYSVENRTKLVLLPIDPTHLHVYWRFAEKPLNKVAVDDVEPKLTLRLFSHPPAMPDNIVEPTWIDFPINKDQQHLQVVLPVENVVPSLNQTIKPETVTQESNQNTWAINSVSLPGDGQSDFKYIPKYSAAIGIKDDSGKVGQGFTVLAYSNTADMPISSLLRDVAEPPAAITQFLTVKMNESSPVGKNRIQQE